MNKGVNSMKKKRKIKKQIRALISHMLIIGIGVFMMYPLLWMISSSFKDNTEIFQGEGFFPNVFRFSNYVEGWAGMSGITFTTFFANSFAIVMLAIIGNLISCSLVAYAFAKIDFPLKKIWFAIMLATLMLPIHVRLIPQYIVFSKLNWLNAFIPLVLPKFFATEGFFVFLMTQYMRSLPRELDDAATVDGCGPFRTYIEIILPLSVPAIITTAIFTFIWTWNDFFSQMIYLNRIEKYTVSVALRMFVDSMGNSSWGALFAMSTLSLVPLMAMFIGFQNYLVDGITSGSVKG